MKCHNGLLSDWWSICLSPSCSRFLHSCYKLRVWTNLQKEAGEWSPGAAFRSTAACRRRKRQFVPLLFDKQKCIHTLSIKCGYSRIIIKSSHLMSGSYFESLFLFAGDSQPGSDQRPDGPAASGAGRTTRCRGSWRLCRGGDTSLFPRVALVQSECWTDWPLWCQTPVTLWVTISNQ